MDDPLHRLHAGRLLRKFLGDKYEFFVLYIFLGGVASIPISIILFALVVNGGRTVLEFPTPRLHFVPGPKSRGTMNLIWVCMSTIFSCVYVSVHGDVPDESKPAAFARTLEGYKVPKFIVTFVRKVYTLMEKPMCKRVLFMLFNVVAPEIIVLVAILELISAYDGLRFMRARKQKKWTLTLAFFADMGGFELDDDEHKHFQDGRKFLEWFDKRWRARGGDVELDAVRIEREIDDRSKSNMVLKMFTLIQSGWLFVVTLARFAEKKAVSELEVTTCAYIFCTGFTYLFWLAKPYNVSTRVVLRESLFRPISSSGKTKETTNHALDVHDESSDNVNKDELKPAVTEVEMPEQAFGNPSSDSRPLSFVTDPLHYRFSSSTSKTFSVYKDASATVQDQPQKEAEDQIEAILKTSTTLPVMIYPNARFTPFNRSYLHPEISWLCMSL